MEYTSDYYKALVKECQSIAACNSSELLTGHSNTKIKIFPITPTLNITLVGTSINSTYVEIDNVISKVHHQVLITKSLPTKFYIKNDNIAYHVIDDNSYICDAKNEYTSYIVNSDIINKHFHRDIEQSESPSYLYRYEITDKSILNYLNGESKCIEANINNTIYKLDNTIIVGNYIYTCHLVRLEHYIDNLAMSLYKAHQHNIRSFISDVLDTVSNRFDDFNFDKSLKYKMSTAISKAIIESIDTKDEL